MSKEDEIRKAALWGPLDNFVRLISPQRMLGDIHKEIGAWWDRPEAKSHQLLLLPRDHMKSALLGIRCARRIIRQPTVRILYISATERLAIKQVKFIKDLLTSPAVRRYWPELILPDEGQREKWTETEIAVDHPLRKYEQIRDPTLFAAGLTTNIVGMHSDVSCFDDVVVPDNAYTEEGREKVLTQYGYLSSIEGAESEQWVVGTHYFPTDLYHVMKETRVETFNADGEVIGDEPMYETFERVVEDSPARDGTGTYIWPRAQRSDGKWFGFNHRVLSRKRAAYRNKTHFFSQYYNDPNDVSDSAIQRSHFQYYDKQHLRLLDGAWTFQGRRLNVFAAIDFAYTDGSKSDWSALAVVGVDSGNNYYVLDLVRFKTGSPSEYFKHILAAQQKWHFRRLRAEVTAAQIVIVKSLKEDYIRPYGLALSIEEYRPTKAHGAKEQRILGTLQPRYENGQMWHYRDGIVDVLESELLASKPPHDDLKNALADAVDSCVAPSPALAQTRQTQQLRQQMTHPRFGGISASR